MTGDLVSVMIGAYNADRYLAEAIDSVLVQTHRPLELIVVDDGSEDSTAEVAQRYAGRLRYVHQERGGLGAARNTAIREARGAFFAFLDADDRFPPDKIERQLAVLRADPTLDLVFGHVTEFLDGEADDLAELGIRAPVANAPWPTPNLMLIRRESFLRVGPFSTSLKVAVGVDWCARALEAGLRSATPEVVVLERRLHTDNNGVREAARRNQYLHVLKASLDRRRAVES